MKRILILLIFFVLNSKLSLLAWTIKDSSTVLALNKETFDLVYNHTALAKSKGLLSLRIASEINYLFGEAQANSRLGIVYDVEGKFDSAIYYYKTSLNINKRIQNKKGQGAALCNIGLLYLNHNKYQEALTHLYAAVKPLEEIKEYQFLGNCYNNIGLLYNELDNWSKAEFNYRRALYYYDLVGNIYQKANVISNLAILYSDLKKNDSSILCIRQAIEIYEREKDYYNLAKNYNNLGILYDETGRRKEAEQALLLSALYADSAGNTSGLADTYINLATLYSDAGNQKESNYYTGKAYKLAEEIESPKLKADIYFFYAKICQKEGRYELATKLLISSKRLKDSIFKSEIAGEIATQEARFGLERKENENNELKQKNRIQKLEIQNRENQIRSRQRFILALSAFGLLLLVFVFVYLKRRYTIQKLKAENLYREEHNKQRVQISHELHDNVGAQLSYIVSNLGILEEKEPDNNRIKSVSEMSKQAIVTLRETVWALNSESISHTGFADKFKQYCSRILEFSPGISIVFEEDLDAGEILQPIEALNLFRICQEAFSNAVKHSGADRIKIKMENRDNGISVSITDNGKGFDEEEALKKGHFGLETMRSRAQEIGAEFGLYTVDSQGTRITVRMHKNTTYV